jgi:cbb3-type cytochrome oxidase subunit 3
MFLFFLGVVIYMPAHFEDWTKDRCLLITWITCVISMFFCAIWGYNIKMKEFANPF